MNNIPGLTVQRTTPQIELHAQLMGILDVDPSTNCLVVRFQVGHIDESGAITDVDHLTDVAWPVGSTVAIRDDKPALIDPTGQTVAHVGDEISVGGGWIPTTTADVESCTGQDHVFMGHHPQRL